MHEFTLSIGIPVYNGEKLIDQTVKSILDQIDEFDSTKLEILISDNASTDSTPIKAKRFQSEYPNLVNYYKNEDNFDAEVNFSLIFKRAKGAYVWLLGCGEILTEGSINNILKRLESDSFDNVLLNFEIFSESLNETETKNGFNIDKDIIFTSKDDFFQSRFYAGMTPISANIIKRQAWARVSHIPIITSGWLHVERIMQLIGRTEYKKTLIVSKPCFINYREKNGWWDRPDRNYLFERSFQILLIFQDMINFGYKQKTINRLCRKHYKQIFKNIIKWKLTGEVNSKSLLNKSFLFYNRFTFWFVLLPILLLPLRKLPDFTINILKKALKPHWQ